MINILLAKPTKQGLDKGKMYTNYFYIMLIYTVFLQLTLHIGLQYIFRAMLTTYTLLLASLMKHLL